MKPNKFYIILAISISICQLSCKKSSFLDTKPNQSLVLLTTIGNYQALLDNDVMMNGTNLGVTPSLGEVGGDNYYVQDSKWVSLKNPEYLRSYLWNSQIYPGQEVADWDLPYQAVFYANSALDGLSAIKVTGQTQSAYNNAEGSALFYRAYMFYQLAQVFAPPYNSATANNDLGIPLRLSSDVNEKLRRSTLQQTYDQIITDVKQSLRFLPVTPLYKTRPSKPAAYALLARTYQTMQNYPLALTYADSCLALDKKLLDFNTVNYAPSNPFINNQYQDEIIFASYAIVNDLGSAPVNTSFAIIDTNLRKSYNANDLRLPVYTTQPLFNLRSVYTLRITPFSGIATDEVYLIRAESNARAGNTAAAMNDLNTLLKTRWKTGTYVNYTATSATDALNQILVERRKELPKRFLRWTDLRRLNLDPNFAVTLKRTYMGQTYTLPPNDPRYTYPIPDNVISLEPGMQQNNR